MFWRNCVFGLKFFKWHVNGAIITEVMGQVLPFTVKCGCVSFWSPAHHLQWPQASVCSSWNPDELSWAYISIKVHPSNTKKHPKTAFLFSINENISLIKKQTYQKKSPILVSPSNTRTPVGVKPRLYSFPSLACTVEMNRNISSRQKMQSLLYTSSCSAMHRYLHTFKSKVRR